MRNKVLLALLSGAHVGVWTAGIATLIFGLLQQNIVLLQLLGLLFAIRWFVQLLLLLIINGKLGRTVGWATFLPMDLAFYIYYVVFGLITLTRRKPRTSWN